MHWSPLYMLNIQATWYIISRFFFSLTQLLKSLHLFSSYFTDSRRCPWAKEKAKASHTSLNPTGARQARHRVTESLLPLMLTSNKISWVSVWPWTPKNIAIKHRKHLREVLEWMSIGLALGPKRAPADGDSGTMWNSMVESFKVWKRTSDETNKLIFWCVIQKTCFLYAVTLPENEWLEDYFHFWDGLVSGAMLGVYLQLFLSLLRNSSGHVYINIYGFPMVSEGLLLAAGGW